MHFIVTGASSGIGFAITKSLASRHHDVTAVARSVDRLSTLKAYHPDRIQIVVADLSTESGQSSVVESASEAGNVDGIVHAAGSLITPTAYQDLTADDLQADLNIHVSTPISLNNSLAEKLAGGRILYIDSYSANNLRIGWSGYSIVKAAAQMAARAAAEEISNATVIRVFPGAVLTPLVETVLSAQKNSATTTLFRELQKEGSIANADVVGEFVANILVEATDEQLREVDVWDFSNADHHLNGGHSPLSATTD